MARVCATRPETALLVPRFAAPLLRSRYCSGCVAAALKRSACAVLPAEGLAGKGSSCSCSSCRVEARVRSSPGHDAKPLRSCLPARCPALVPRSGSRRVPAVVLRAWVASGTGSSLSCSSCWRRDQAGARGAPTSNSRRAPTSTHPHRYGRAPVWRTRAQRNRGCSVCSGLTKRGLARRGAPSGSRFFFVLFFYILMGN